MVKLSGPTSSLPFSSQHSLPMTRPAIKMEDYVENDLPKNESDIIKPRRSSRKRSAPQTFDPSVTKKVKKELKSVKKEPNKIKKKSSHRKKTGKGKVSKVKRGLKGHPAVDVNAPLGVVDPAAEINGVIYNTSDGGETVAYDVMMVLVDKEKNMDKFIVLQLIQEDKKENNFVVYERWGRTGTSGTSLVQNYSKVEDALKVFKDKFVEKTALQWANRSHPCVEEKYRFVIQDFEAKHQASISDSPLWQYWVDDGVDGKVTGWYDYDDVGNTLTEQLYLEFQSNLWLTERIVTSGMYAYLVNLESMTQTNVVHPNHTARHIRRVPPGEEPSNANPMDDYPNVLVAPVLNLSAKKPNVLRTKIPPLHKVEPALTAGVPVKGKAESKEEKVEVKLESENALQIPVDALCPDADKYSVIDDFDATLNQSNIMGGNNNNKYYRIQMLRHEKKKTLHVWTRWGRVGESRGTQTKLIGPFRNPDKSFEAFNKKFRDKTANDWNDRADFSPVDGKYELLEIDHKAKKEENADPLVIALKAKEDDVEYLPSSLPDATRDLIELLFEKDVYVDAMKQFDIDIRKMPLGALSTDQIQKGMDVLVDIENQLKTARPSREELERLSSKFYTTLPHDFGRRRPPVIRTQDMLQRCYDMCNVLLDMEKATTLMTEAANKTNEEQEKKEKKKVPHPTDAQYASLDAELNLVEEGSAEHDIVREAFQNTKGHHEASTLLNIWRVEREGEAARFNSVKLENHRLLWHGSHIGAISAILATGLRIMPHSGGRVGKGIYLASENGKSQNYTTPACKRMIGCMFLAEAALGKMCEILEDDNTLEKAPNGYDSVLACGRQTPSGFKDMKLDNESVRVAVEKPADNPMAGKSNFLQDEFLIYNEAQARIRYVITLQK